MPAGPAERAIPVRITKIEPSARSDKDLNDTGRAECRRAMQRRFATCSHVAHKRCCGDSGASSTIGICAGLDKTPDNCVEASVPVLAQSGVQRRFAGLGQRLVHIRAEIDQAIDQVNVTVKNGTVEVQIVAHLCRGSACPDQCKHSGGVSVIGAPLQQRKTLRIYMHRVAACLHVRDNLVSSPAMYRAKHVWDHVAT